MSEIRFEITGIVIAILTIIILIVSGINRYLLSNVFFSLLFYSFLFLFVSIAIIEPIRLYKQKRKREKDVEEQTLLQLVREKLEFTQKANELQEKVDQKTERERQLEFEKQEFELARQRFELEKERTSHALEAAKTAREMANILYPEISPEAKAAIVSNLIPTLLHYSDMGTFERVRQKLLEEA